MQVVVFKIGREEYGFPIESVKEIVLLQKRTSMPNMPEFFEGIVNLRGTVIPVMNLAEKFSLLGGEQAEGKDGKLIVLNLENEKKIAIRADEVSEILTVKEADLEAPPDVFGNRNESCISNVIKYNERLIIVLDSSRLISQKILDEIEI